MVCATGLPRYAVTPLSTHSQVPECVYHAGQRAIEGAGCCAAHPRAHGIHCSHARPYNKCHGHGHVPASGCGGCAPCDQLWKRIERLFRIHTSLQRVSAITAITPPPTTYPQKTPTKTTRRQTRLPHAAPLSRELSITLARRKPIQPACLP